jgi:hypothetical protein
MCLSFAATLGFGLTQYRGQLMDAACYNQNPSTTGEKVWVRCAPTDSTTTFAIHTDGKIRMLNTEGNDKALTAYKSGILKRDKNGDMPVIVQGYRHGNTIKVEGIRGHKSDTSVH